MTTGSAPKTQLTWRGFVGLMGLFAGLCTIFALVVTVAEGWQEHRQAQWPAAVARIQGCGVDPTSSGERSQIICRLSYVVGGDEIVTKVYSRSIPSPKTVIWEYPSNSIGRLEEWVDAHPEGTEIEVHYDPANHKKAALVATDMPLGGPRTPSNLRLLGFVAVSCVVLLAIARSVNTTRPRT